MLYFGWDFIWLLVPSGELSSINNKSQFGNRIEDINCVMFSDSLYVGIIIEIIDNISKELTIILVSHKAELIRNCDKVIKLESGEIIFSGNPSDLKLENWLWKDTHIF